MSPYEKLPRDQLQILRKKVDEMGLCELSHASNVRIAVLQKALRGEEIRDSSLTRLMEYFAGNASPALFWAETLLKNEHEKR